MEYYDDFLKFTEKEKIEFYSQDNLIDIKDAEDLICPICLFILKDPISCSDKENGHSFCKKCIDNYLKGNNKCPTCKLNFTYKINNQIKDLLNNIPFRCMFRSEGCNDIISYTEYLNHINNCNYNNKYICKIKKYNHTKKNFEICGYTGNKNEIIKHFKICAFNSNLCIFCDEFIFQMDLENHMKIKCKFGIINYSNKDKYIGEKENNIREGYG